MNDITQKATTELIVDGEQAKHELELINDRIKQVDTQLRAARKAGDADLVKSLKSQKEQLIQNKKSLQKEAIDVNKILNSLSTAKPKELNATIKELTRQMGSPHIKRGSKDWKFLNDQIKRCRQELNQVNAELQLGQSKWERATGFINKYAGMIATGIAAITGISLAFSKLRDERDKLESSAAGVKALTGLGDKDVAWLTDQAKKLSTSVTSEGVRIKQSATEISDSFGVIGSQRPELLANAEALKQVTQDAIYLSIAGKDKLEPAAKALTTVMNQMNLGASESRRIINAIAAGSQAGAGNIQYITDAFEKSGTTANMMNIQFEQLLGLIETVAPKYSEAAVAGTSLDRVLLRMKTNNIGYKDGVFDLGRAIDEINKRFSQGESATSLFGEEHAKMATILANSKSEVERYTLAVTGTNQAVTQANINSDINEVKRQQARNKMTLMGIELMDKLNPSITGIMNATVNWTGKLVVAADWISKNTTLVIILATELALYTAAIKLNAYWETINNEGKGRAILLEKTKLIWVKASTAATHLHWAAMSLLNGHVKDATRSMKAFLVTLGINPITAAAIAVTVLTIGLYKLFTQTSDAEKAMAILQKRIRSVESEAAQSIAKQKTELDMFLRLARDESESKERRLSAIKKINDISPEYLGNLTLEEINTDKATTAINRYITSIHEMAKAQAAKEQLVEIEKEKLRLDTDPEAFQEQIPFLEEMEVGLFGLFSKEKADKMLADMVARGRVRRDKTKESLEAQAKALRKMVADSSKNVNNILSGDTGGGGSEEKSKKSLLKIQQDLREEAEKKPETTEAEITAKNKLIETIDKEIARLKELGTTKNDKSKNDKESEKLKKEFEQTLKLNDEYHSAFKNQEKKRYLDQEINSAVYNKHIEMLEMASLDNRIELMKQFNEKLKPEHEKLRINIEQEQEKLLDKRIAFLKKWEKKVSLSDYLGGVDQEEEEADPELDKLIEKTKRSYEYKQAALKNEYENNEITQLEYQQRERDLQQEHLTEMLSSRIAFADQVSRIAQQAAQLVNTLSQREELAVDNKYAAQLKAAKGNAEKTAAIEEQMEEEKKAIKKKYADIDFAITAAQIIANTAGGIMKLWAEMGIAALPLQFLVGATGLAQLLLANEQRQQVKNLWTGGYTSPGRWDEPKGIVHSEEFVGNRFAVRNKAVNRVFRMIDVAQKNNTIATINETDIIRALGGRLSPVPQKETTYQATPSGTDPHVTEALLLLSTTVRDLKKQMQEGTLARTYVTGDGGTKTARDKYDKMLKNVTRYNKK